MAEYLLPFNDKMSIDEKQRMFSVKNRMVDIPDNFGKVEQCACGQTENMSHIYSCTYLNKEEIILPYEKIFDGNMSEQIEVFRRFETNLERRNQIKSESETKSEQTRISDKPPCDQSTDPLNCVQYSIG